ncbi:MAG: flagellar hook-associated protein FlgK [Pseudomonadota bacterium]|nr:flagellar hook-associated protein FlgK [Pseudomonadota bacterium]
MASGTLGIALTGLNAAQAGIRTSQHNIANVNTAGFRRQEVDYASLTPNFSGSGYFGTGVGVSTVRNLYSQFQDSQVLLNQGQLSRNEAYASQASQIDTLAGDANSGLTGAMDAFFSATQTVATDPTSNAARQVMLSSGRNLAARFNTLSSAFNNIRVDTNHEIAATVTRINTYAGQIAQLSGNIAQGEASNGQPANDLRDQRDQLVAELNKLINVTPVQQGDGAFNLFIGSGQPLVVGSSVTTMSSVADATNTEFDVPALNLAGGATQPLDASVITGGKLGGLLAAREAVLQPAMQDLDRLALTFSAQFNGQHDNGYDKSGVLGTNFFTASTTLFQQPAAGTGNTGTQVINATLTNAALLEASNYELSYDGTNYTLTRLSDGVSSAAGTLAAVTTIGGVAQGFTLAAGAGAPVAGDAWLLRPSHGAAGSLTALLTDPNKIAASSSSAGSPGDNANALLLAGLQTQANTVNGTDTFSSAYAQLVARTATLASEADINVAAYETLTSQAKQAQQAVSGVNLDEEAANLIRFQQAYQASAKAMQVASSLFDDLIGILR